MRSFNRGARGQNALRQILAPVVKEIIEGESLNVRTDPVDIYKCWVNQMGCQNGEAGYGSCCYCFFLKVAQLLCIALLIVPNHPWIHCMHLSNCYQLFSISSRWLSSERYKDHLVTGVLSLLEVNLMKR